MACGMIKEGDIDDGFQVFGWRNLKKGSVHSLT